MTSLTDEIYCFNIISATYLSAVKLPIQLPIFCRRETTILKHPIYWTMYLSLL